MTTKVAVVGASGRMGQLVCRIVEETPGFDLVARIGSSGVLSEMIGADLVVDVTIPAVSHTIVDFALEHDIKVLVGTSGWSSDRLASLGRRIARNPRVGAVVIPNFSVGSVLATRFATMAARFYESIEIVEAHHASKIDSPSGTAVRTAELISEARAELGPASAPHTDQRARGQQVASIPVHSLRLQGVVAKQDVVFGGPGEILTISHDTLDQSAYEAGIVIALRAAITNEGLVVGLDRLIDLGGPDRRGTGSFDGLAATRVADKPSGQAATATSAS